jgi:uncharacterized protein YjbI with pentapeptide repeats
MIEIRHKETGQVLQRAPGKRLVGRRLGRLKLIGADLRSADLTRADLRGADLTGADLSGASLAGACRRPWREGSSREMIQWCLWMALCGTAAVWASMHLIRLFFDTPAGAAPGDRGFIYLFCAWWTFFIGGWSFHAVQRRLPTPTVKLQGALLLEADLRDANLKAAEMQGAELGGATLNGAELGGADLHAANLRGVQAFQTRLARADLSEVDFHGANLRGADLRQADLRDAELEQADLRGADLRGADMRWRVSASLPLLHGARYDETTRWPASFQPARHGAVMTAEVVPAAVPPGRGDEPIPSGLPSAEPGGDA